MISRCLSRALARLRGNYFAMVATSSARFEISGRRQTGNRYLRPRMDYLPLLVIIRHRFARGSHGT
jgi:hypothetical protein